MPLFPLFKRSTPVAPAPIPVVPKIHVSEKATFTNYSHAKSGDKVSIIEKQYVHFNPKWNIMRNEVSKEHEQHFKNATFIKYDVIKPEPGGHGHETDMIYTVQLDDGSELQFPLHKYYFRVETKKQGGRRKTRRSKNRKSRRN